MNWDINLKLLLLQVLNRATPGPVLCLLDQLKCVLAHCLARRTSNGLKNYLQHSLKYHDAPVVKGQTKIIRGLIIKL